MKGKNFLIQFCKNLYLFNNSHWNFRKFCFYWNKLNKLGIYLFFFIIVSGQILHATSTHQRCYIKKSVLRNFTKFTGKHLRQGLFLIEACNFIKKETLARVFSCEFCEISKNTFFTEHLYRTASSMPTQHHIYHQSSFIYFIVQDTHL